MPKLKQSMILALLLTLSLLFSGNNVYAAPENPDSSNVDSVSENSDSNKQEILEDSDSNNTQEALENSDIDNTQEVSNNSDSNNVKEISDIPDSDIIRLVCPTEYPFFIARNPEKTVAHLNSQIFYIANYSNKDILIDLSNIHLESEENVTYNELSAPLEDGYVSDTKDVFAFLKILPIDPAKVPSSDDLRTGEIPPSGALPEEGDFILTGENKTTDYKVLLKAANYNENGEFVSFQPESIFSFYIAGSVTPNKDLIWNEGDISIKVIINYSVVPAKEEKSPETDKEKSSEADEVKSPDAGGEKAPDASTDKPTDSEAKEVFDNSTKEPSGGDVVGKPDVSTEEPTEISIPSGTEPEEKDEGK